ncbi:cupin domain-containing protein [Propionivibrio sp.]|uniref:cupin domain-containing protein n=1 Tax=Propionivibrio sp. TaxID=2212460 RepID=UPI0025D3728F|nr:cupin domain-containing protein [Propionivibrio sp.]MBK7357363.1 cupin domain-containing protein [Propionivibrio sp.]MBK8401233.1 cupin domain-containing protein [Propionivibrio sp.]MBK8743211.1 cupin domain-containing protein [Propionivibrio sp.]MBK8894784.1 cupin domain-containing protein [Propionivibrio sp.]MBL0209004.1 cupin domain-containing protein [Propionivibrio sp.]
MTRRSRHPDPMLAPPVIEALLEAQTPGLPPPERMRALRQRVLDSVVAEQRVDTAGHLTIRGVEGIWIPLLPGISMKLLREDASTRSYLLRMAPGSSLPAHNHIDEEECMVLEGEVRLGDVHAQAGDYHLARSGLPHGSVSTLSGCLLFLRGQKHYGDLRAG